VSRTLIAYVDGPNEGPAEMVIIGGYRWKQSISWAALRWLPRLRFPRQPGRNQPIHRAETRWVCRVPAPAGRVWRRTARAQLLRRPPPRL